jgi:hypothetical protein
MPTLSIKSAAEYRERAKKLRLAAETARHRDTRHQLLVIAADYEELAEDIDLIGQHPQAD